MKNRGDGPESVPVAVPPYTGNEELQRCLDACNSTLSVDEVVQAAETCVTRREGLNLYVGELLRSVRMPDNTHVAKLLECALGLWNHLIQAHASHSSRH